MPMVSIDKIIENLLISSKMCTQNLIHTVVALNRLSAFGGYRKKWFSLTYISNWSVINGDNLIISEVVWHLALNRVRVSSISLIFIPIPITMTISHIWGLPEISSL